MFKTCTKCKTEKPITSFSRRRLNSPTPQWASQCNCCKNKANLSHPSYLSRLKNPDRRQIKRTALSDEERRINNNERNKLWRKANPHKWKLANRANRHRRRAAGTIDIDLWNLKLRTLNYQCACCGTNENITIDHILPISKGGDNSIANLQPLCLLCNKTKFTKYINYLPESSKLLS